MMHMEFILLIRVVIAVYQVDKIEWVSGAADLDGAFGLVHRVPAAIIRSFRMERHQKRLQSICFAEVLHLSRGYCGPSAGPQRGQWRQVRRPHTVALDHIVHNDRELLNV